MKKTIGKLLLVFFLMIIYAYTLSIENIPKELVIFEGETISLNTLFGINIKVNSETMETASSTSNTNSISQNSGTATLKVSLFDTIDLKDVNVDILPKTKVIPVGSIAGVKLYTSGVLVVRNVRNRRC